MGGAGARRQPRVPAAACRLGCVCGKPAAAPVHTPPCALFVSAVGMLQNKKKMSLEDFARINRSTNEGDPMPRDLLEGIYASISRDELKISSGGLSRGCEGGVELAC